MNYDPSLSYEAAFLPYRPSVLERVRTGAGRIAAVATLRIPGSAGYETATHFDEICVDAKQAAAVWVADATGNRPSWTPPDPYMTRAVAMMTGTLPEQSHCF